MLTGKKQHAFRENLSCRPLALKVRGDATTAEYVPALMVTYAALTKHGVSSRIGRIKTPLEGQWH